MCIAVLEHFLLGRHADVFGDRNGMVICAVLVEQTFHRVYGHGEVMRRPVVLTRHVYELVRRHLTATAGNWLFLFVYMILGYRYKIFFNIRCRFLLV